MRLLALDTTGPFCAVAIRMPGKDDVIRCEEIGRGHAERLAPMAQDALCEAELSPADLDRIAVTTGPGSFAGTRVGIAFARGLALATGAEVLGISNMALLANQIRPFLDHSVMAVHDAKRGEVVVQLFDQGKPITEPKTRSVADAKADILSMMDQIEGVGAMVAIGSGAKLVVDGSPDPVLPPDMNTLLDMAIEAEPPFERPKPFYARPPDAKLPGGVTPK